MEEPQLVDPFGGKKGCAKAKMFQGPAMMGGGCQNRVTCQEGNDALYEPKRCCGYYRFNPAKGQAENKRQCWCVDEKTGKEVDGTRVKTKDEADALNCDPSKETPSGDKVEEPAKNTKPEPAEPILMEEPQLVDPFG